MDWINKIHMITEKMKNQMHAKGIDSLDRVYLAIAQFDSNQTGYVEKVFFEEFLAKIGIFLKSQELTEIHKYLNTYENENRVFFENFVHLLKCEVPEYLNKVILDVFERIQDGNGTISLENLKRRLNLEHHQRVKLMLKDRSTVNDELNIAISFVIGDKDYMDINEFTELHRNMYWVTPRENLTNLFNTIQEIWS